ncbi:MAG: hypothetical protein JXR76_05340 [Deltaproteobacteria bacterium]|nr:hypothetical protein [Deltaproteobacteria bacterium]
MTRQMKTVSATDLMALAKSVVERDGVFWFRSRGFSMEPDIGNQELVAICKVSFDDVQAGDVLLCDTIDKPILHRVIRRDGSSSEPRVILKSDVGNQIHCVSSHEVVGKLVAVHQSPVRLFKWHLRQLARNAAWTLFPEHMQKRRSSFALPQNAA